MKKLVTLLAAAGMVVAASAPANAVDVKVDGFQMFTFERQHYGFADMETGDNSETVKQRTRLGLKLTASENLSGYIQFQMGSETWGDYTRGSGGDKHGRYDVQTRQAYVDWIVPGTAAKVRMGRQQLGLPADAFGGNAIMAAGWGGRDGIAVSTPVADWLGLNAFWVRAANDEDNDVDRAGNADMFGLAAPMKFNGFSVTPYIAYAAIDEEVAGHIGISETEDIDLAGAADVYWAGFSSTFTVFDPFTVKLSAAYGKAEYDSENVGDDRDGWYVQAKASYKLDFGTPVFGAWYASGDDKRVDNAGEGWIPMVNGQFTPTTSFHNGAYGLGGELALENIAGTCGIQLGIENVSFITDLTHEFKVTWMQGTNHKDHAADAIADEIPAANYLTTEDNVFSFDFGTTYNIYKNFAANLELSYLINDFGSEYTNAGYDEDDWRVALTFKYSF